MSPTATSNLSFILSCQNQFFRTLCTGWVRIAKLAVSCLSFPTGWSFSHATHRKGRCVYWITFLAPAHGQNTPEDRHALGNGWRNHHLTVLIPSNYYCLHFLCVPKSGLMKPHHRLIATYTNICCDRWWQAADPMVGCCSAATGCRPLKEPTGSNSPWSQGHIHRQTIFGNQCFRITSINMWM